LHRRRLQVSLFLYIQRMEAVCFQDRSVYVELIKKQVRFVWYIVSQEREQMSSQNYRQEIRLIFLVRLEMAL